MALTMSSDELLMPVPLHIAAGHRSIEHIERGEQRRRAAALEDVRHRRPSTALQREPRLRTIQRLDLALFVNRQDDGVSWRRDVEPDDIVQLLGERLVVRQLEAAPAM